MKVNGYVYGTNANEMHFSLDITDAKLVALIHDHLIADAYDSIRTGHHKEAEKLLHDANHLADLLGQYNTATAEGGTEQ